ncbi:unnamed protein product [Spirodela intermedia]|uniref:Uncharacterized protein n=1 Tax=Spirodela intermedia TaxID=51605 RepID=A0A7I8IM98_SPIIN|nr:unnamed protein product [Spirodela intermedia]CAA6658091.1 unnamed protein product [Spirodela intermedia]CAA6675728.1 unnamed protein product [Spirodela intermedia]
MIINTGMILLQNNTVERHQRGAANGIAMAFMSLFEDGTRAAKRQTAPFLPDDQVIFFALNVVDLIGILLTCRPFLALRNEPSSS